VMAVAPAFGPIVPSPPALETAAAKLAPVIQFMGAWIMGCSIPRSSQILVLFIAASLSLFSSAFYLLGEEDVKEYETDCLQFLYQEAISEGGSLNP